VASVIDTFNVDEKLVPLAGVKVGVPAVGFGAGVPGLPEPQLSIKASRTKHAAHELPALFGDIEENSISPVLRKYKVPRVLSS
jgi:hypothetical protein